MSSLSYTSPTPLSTSLSSTRTAKPLLRPIPVPPYSSTNSSLLSPTRSSFAPSIASSSMTARPSPPPRPISTSSNGGAVKRYPSPPNPNRERPRSVLGGLSMRAGSPGASGNLPGQHHQQSLAALQGPTKEELEKFAELCKMLYFDQDPTAAQAVDQTLQRLPATSRTAYARTMASIRSSFHLSEEIRRRAAVLSVLSSSTPSSHIKSELQISEGGTSALRSSRAQALRAEKLKAFLKSHCLKGLPGSLPFVRGLYGVLKLQSEEEGRGGAGRRRVEWKVDVNVFTEAGGGDWMKDSVKILKSVLGFTECTAPSSSPSSPTTSYFEEEEPDDVLSAPTLISPLSSSPESPITSFSTSRRGPPPKVPPHRPMTLRTRAVSDPFLDPNERERKNGGISPPLMSPVEDSLLLPPTSSTSNSTSTDSSTNTSSRSSTPPTSSSSTPVVLPTSSPPPEFRIFTTPSFLTDPEIHSLLSLFPDFVITPNLRFPSSSITSSVSRRKVEDEESGVGVRDGEEAGVVKVGHGEIRLAPKGVVRENGWNGSGWWRFLRWLKRAFGG